MGIVKIREQAGWERAVEKQISRELDIYKVATGLATVNEQAVLNDYFAQLNLSGFKICAIGGKSLQE
jgi:hypothetical protein